MNKRVLSFLGIAVICVIGAAFLSINISIQSRLAMPEALAMLESDAEVRVSEGEWITLAPASGQPDTGLIFFPGGYVDVRAYAPIARLLAERGYMVVLVEPPLATALLAVGDVPQIAAAYPQIEHWAVGGHSLGGVAAAQAADQNPGLVDGLVLIAAAPASGNNLSGSDLDVLAIFGSEDAIFPQSRLDPELVPNTSTFVEIEGANHAQFGRYGNGTQSGDGAATISRENQELESAGFIEIFLAALGE